MIINKMKVLILLGVLILWFACSSQKVEEQQEEKILVKTAKVVRKDIRLPIHTSGKLLLKSEMKLAFKTGGIIQDIYVDDGAVVDKGVLLAKLDVAEIKAHVDQAHSGHEKAQRDYQRVQKLYADSAATYEQLQNAQTALDVASSQLAIAEFNLLHSSIVAPARGKILKRLAEANEMVSPGMPIFIFGSLEKSWIVKVGVTDRDIPALELGDSALVQFDAYPNQKLTAVVSQIAAAANPMSGTYDAELTLDATDLKLFSGFVAKVSIIPKACESFYVIPIEALADADAKQGHVYTVESNVAKTIPVQIGRLLESEVAIVAGLENVDRVVTDGAADLADGDRVQVLN